jgi:predicted HicB family RNase H-like nuclease
MVLRAKKERRSTAMKTAVLEEAGKQDTTRLNAEIPITLHTQVKLRAAQERNSMTDIVIKALVEYLNKSTNE